jgi:hypothetical protein
MLRHPIVARAHQALGALAMLARFTRDVPAFLREPITLSRSLDWQRERLAAREPSFLRVAEQQIYGYPGSPYLKLLRAAGCELGDLRRLVHSEGLEGALEDLVQRGVYVTFDELKGRREAVRGSQRFTFSDRDFDNPLLTAHFEMQTGGTSGKSSRVLRSLDFLTETSYCLAAGLDAHDLLRVPQAFWATGPVNYVLRYSKMRVPMRAWFYPLTPLPWDVWLGGLYLAALGLASGQRHPLPIYCDVQQPEPLVRWLAEHIRDGGEVCLRAPVSSAVRIAAEAMSLGVSLDGVTFFLRSEPYTEAKMQTIRWSGARAIVSYGLTEGAMIGMSCATPSAPDDVHVFDSRYALVERSRPVGEHGPEVNALLVTTLSDQASKTLLNVESGDYADLERRDCGCLLGALGLRTHLSNIRSYEKLTGEGMTFARTNLTQVIEAVLPARFGGTSVDYQVLEEERPGGLPRLALRVSPTVGPVDEDEVRAVFLETLAQDGAMERYMAAFWERANTIEVERELPVVTSAGKVLPFQLVRARTAIR